jgi:hypothetical protein
MHLAENEHVEWTLLRKISRIGNSIIYSRCWDSIESKVRTLCAEARDGNLRGLPAAELLNTGGSKHLMWVDIDSGGSNVTEWINNQKIFPKGSFVEVVSTTGNVHLYVATDKPLIERWQSGMRTLIARSMPKYLARKMDRVYGPECRKCIFIPTDGLTGGGLLPQQLCSNLSETYKLPVNKIEMPAWVFY